MEPPRDTAGEPGSKGRSGYLAVNGARLYYAVEGEGTPLVLLHAGIADHRQWDDQVPAFTSRYRVIRYDHRGWGRSDAPPGPVAFHEDLYGVLQRLDIERAHLVGISMGGTFAIDFALTYPGMVASLVLAGSWLSGYREEPTTAEQAIWAAFEAALEKGDVDRANELEVDLKLVGIYRTPDQLAPAVRERLLRIHREAFDRLDERQRMRPWLTPAPPAVSRLHELHVPTLITYGDLDVPAATNIAALLARDIAGARSVVMRGTAHVPNMEQPETFNRIVLEFLSQLERTPEVR